MTDDDRLLAELGAAVRGGQQVPEGIRRAGRAAFAWRTVDAELAELSYDSAPDSDTGAAGPPGESAGGRVGALSGARADSAQVRALTFVGPEVSVEVELTEDVVQGQVVPAVPGEIELQVPDGTRVAVPLDEVGWFAFDRPARGLFRLQVLPTAGTPTITSWVSG